MNMLATSENFLNGKMKYGHTFQVHYDKLLYYFDHCIDLVYIEVVRLA